MTTNYLTADIANLEAHIHELFAAYPDLAEDEELRADMLEGETDLHSVLTRLVNIERDADSMAKAIAERQRDLSARKARSEKRKDAMRALMLRVMKAAGATKAQLPEATVSVSKGRDSVDIIDDKKLPRWAYETVRKPDKKAIMERLAANKNVPGAALVTGDDMVSVRVV